MRKLLIGEISEEKFNQLKKVIAQIIREVQHKDEIEKAAGKILKMFMFSKK